MFRSTGRMIALLVIASGIAFAQPGERMRPREARGEMRRDLIESLQLSDAQKGQMQKLRLDFEKKQVAIHSKIQTERLDMKELFLADNPDRAAIEKHMRAVSDLQYQAKLNHLGHWYEVKAILTPDQQKTWKVNLGEFWEHEGGPGPRGRMMRERIIEHMDKEE